MSPDLYLVLHIPKTAGTTLAANFQRNFKKEEWLPIFPTAGNGKTDLGRAVEIEIQQHKTPYTRCVWGHWVYPGIHQRIRPESRPRYITFLREPVARCISAYGYIKTQPTNRNYRVITDNNWSLGQWLEHGDEPELSNGQIRHLLFDGSDDILSEHLTRDHLEVARQKLSEFWFVGLTETFDFDASYLYGQLNFWRFNIARVVNATPQKTVATPEEKRALTLANELDCELFAFARQLRGEWMREHAREVRLQRRKARLMKQIYTGLWSLRQAARSHRGRS